jgi:hypothetical protein
LMMPCGGMMLLTAEQYFEQRRKQIDRYVQGEHKWLGDLSTSMPAVSMCMDPLPWYVK